MLADAFEENRYNEELQQIAADQGRLSDSGDSIVDKHSGYIIKKLDYVTLEAYDEKGFKIISNGIQGSLFVVLWKFIEKKMSNN